MFFLLNLLTSYYSSYGSGYGSSYGGYSSSYSPNYSSYSSSSDDLDDVVEALIGGGAITGIFVVIMIIIGLVGLVLGILTIIAQWKVFKKAGRQGWECLIAGHNYFEMFDMSNINPAFTLLLLFGACVPFVGSLAVIVMEFYLLIKLAQSFGRSAGFGVGLVLLGPIFWPILGFGKSQYQGVYYSSQSHEAAKPQTPPQANA